MSEEKATEKDDTPRDGVPAPLLDDLHQANEQFHRAREHVEQAAGALVNPLDQRQQASQELHEAEKAVEDAEEKIEKELGRKSS